MFNMNGGARTRRQRGTRQCFVCSPASSWSHTQFIMAQAAPLLVLASELCDMNMWGAMRATRGGRELTLVEAINRVEIMQKTPPLVQWAARLPSNRLAKQMYDQAFQGERPVIVCALSVELC